MVSKGEPFPKGAINNRMSNFLMGMLEKHGVPTSLGGGAQRPGDCGKKGDHCPLEVIIPEHLRRLLLQTLGGWEGIVFDEPTIEFSYKNDDLGDPLINSYHALALKAGHEGRD